MRALLFCLVVSALSAAEKSAVAPPGIKPIGPYSPGILTRDFLYVSGQGAKNAQGQVPGDIDGQLRQMFENVKTIVDAGGLTMAHVVYAQVYLSDASDEGPLDRVWKEYFPKSPPARSTVGIAKLPGTPVEMSAVAIRDLGRRKVVAPGAVVAGDRMYLSGVYGRDP